MTVSVVIPSKDRAGWLRRTIPKYLAQECVSEVIVVVDGSTDDSVGVLQQLANAAEKPLRVVVHERNKGTPTAKNAGIEVATGQYIFVGEDDVEVTDGFMQTLLGHLNSGSFDLMSGRNVWRDEGESEASALARADAIAGPYFDRRALEIHTGYRVATDVESLLVAAPILVRAAVFDVVRFDSRYRVNFWREESDFQLSAHENGFRVGVCPHAVCFNYVITNDRSGSHAAVGVRRVLWKVRNNWYFVQKHRELLREEAGFRFSRLYIACFASRSLWLDIVAPLLVVAKKRLLDRLRTDSAR